MNEQITNLIENVSNETINRFFKHKISSYYEDSENYDYLLKEAEFAKFSDIEKLGQAEFENADDLLVFSAKYSGNLSERSSKKQQYEIAKKVLREDFKDGAIFVFYDNEGRFRFSFLRKNYGDKTQKFTPWRRFTYFVNPENTNKTFVSRIDKCNFTNLDVIQEAFSVEPLSEQFYKDLSHWYFAALLEVDFPNDTKIDEMKNKTNAMIRLITRLIFVWFMKQKKLIPDDLFDKDKIDELINYQDKTGSTYYKAILQNLFFATLNIPIDKGRKFVNRQPGVQVFYRYKRFIKNEDLFFELMDKIPYLNGGLFENLDIVKPEEKIEMRVDCFSDRRDNENRLTVPDNLFFGEHNADISKFFQSETKVIVTGIIDLLKRYDFTIDENTPYDMEVALDPELLGLVFENLLASYNPETESTARKESGSFYTPRVVVDYMIEESLVNYLNHKTDYDYEKIKLLVSNTDSQPFETETEKKNIVEILSNIKILDPACGSGAFPMGALQKLVHVLAKLDSDNSIWHKIQKELAIRDTATAYDIGDEEERKMRLKIIEDAFEKGINDPDYARKLFLIENCMYGVDIQPIAMQISKLRFFISLLVDQKPDIKRDNFGIIALPNLETKFVAANTLIKLPGTNTQQLSFKDQRVEELEKELKQIRHDLFSARTAKTKEKRRKRHVEIQEEIGKILVESGFPSVMAEAIKDWKAFNPNSSADWFDPYWMFGLDNFDIVIGNPPYIQLQKALPDGSGLKYADLYKNENYKTFERTGDIYALFYEKGLSLLKNKGLLCYITSNKWMRAGYGKSLREFLASKNPLLLIDMGPGIFKAATVDTNVLLVENFRTKEHKLNALTLKNKNQLSELCATDFTQMNKLTDDSWIILKPEEKSIKEKIEKTGKPLKDWDVKINYGIKTGYNEAFIIDGKTKEELIQQDPKSAEIIKPILRGRDIKRYKAEFADLWLIATFPALKIDIDSYPAIKKYLESFGERLHQIGESYVDSNGTIQKTRKKTGNKWFETQDQIAYYEEFEKEKVVWKRIGSVIRFSISSIGELCLDSTVVMTGEKMKFLVALLNTKLMIRELLKNSPQTGTGDVIISVQALEPMLIVYPTTEQEVRISTITDLICKKIDAEQDTSLEEREIDLLVYKLYGLTYSEVLVVDSEFWMSEGEYEGYEV